jgi:hypothetical protein
MDKDLVEMEKGIFKGEYCEDCQKEREDHQFPFDDECNKKTVKGNDRKYYRKGIDRRSDMLVGIYSKDCKPPIDVLLVTFGHGGGPWKKKPLKFEEMKKEIETHYHDKEKYIETFHQFAIRELLEKLDKNDASWYLTDLIKCYVHTHNKKGERKGDENKKRAIENCKNYLEKQVMRLKPKVTVLFGGDVQRGIFEQVLKPKKEFSEEVLTKEVLDNQSIKELQRPYEETSQSGTKFGFEYFSHGRCVKNVKRIFGHETQIMFSIFPTGNTSNLWVAANFEKGPSSPLKLVERIIKEARRNNAQRTLYTL